MGEGSGGMGSFLQDTLEGGSRAPKKGLMNLRFIKADVDSRPTDKRACILSLLASAFDHALKVLAEASGSYNSVFGLSE